MCESWLPLAIGSTHLRARSSAQYCASETKKRITVKEGPLCTSPTCEHRICPSGEGLDPTRSKGAHSDAYSSERRLRVLTDNWHIESPFFEDIVHKVLYSEFSAVVAACIQANNEKEKESLPESRIARSPFVVRPSAYVRHPISPM